VNSQTGTRTDTIDPGAENDHHAPGAKIMSFYEVIVGNVGSVYLGKSRTTALAIYESYVEISKEHVGARCFGEDVTLLADGEIEQEHTGHLNGE
jgi:hypothetical protein